VAVVKTVRFILFVVIPLALMAQSGLLESLWVALLAI